MPSSGVSMLNETKGIPDPQTLGKSRSRHTGQKIDTRRGDWGHSIFVKIRKQERNHGGGRGANSLPEIFGEIEN